MNFWRKLNHLVPEPQCNTKGVKTIVGDQGEQDEGFVFDENDGLITAWHDVRPQPTNREIFDVDMADVEVSELEHQENNFIIEDMLKKLGKAVYLQHNMVRELEGKQPITFRKFVQFVKTL